jgi:Sap, sulfolipid-1-addressing protein
VNLLEIFLLGVGSAFWPLLLVVVLIALTTQHPGRLLGWFYLGGMLTSVSVGAAMVFALQGSSLMTGRSLPSAPWVDITIGALALLGGIVLLRSRMRRLSHPRPKKKSRSSEWIEHLAESGGALTFVAGIVATIFPAPLAIIAMADIAQLGYSTAETFAVIVFFYVVMFVFIEVPLVGLAVAPNWTRARVTPLNAWLNENLLRLAAWALLAFGSLEVVRGVVTAVRQ